MRAWRLVVMNVYGFNSGDGFKVYVSKLTKCVYTKQYSFFLC